MLTAACALMSRPIALQHHRSKFVGASGAPQDPVFSAFKHHWSDSRKEVMLCPLNSSFVQLGSTGKPIARYWYKSIEAICLVSDYPGGFCIFYGGVRQLRHIFWTFVTHISALYHTRRVLCSA